MECTKVFVGSLPPNTKPQELRHLFEDYGIVVECDIMNRCGFVHMKNVEMAESAIIALNGTKFKGQSIVVERGRPRTYQQSQFRHTMERKTVGHYGGRDHFIINDAPGYDNRHSNDGPYEEYNKRFDDYPRNYEDRRGSIHQFLKDKDGFMENSYTKSNKPGPYYNLINNINNNGSYETEKQDKYHLYNENYYRRSERISRNSNDAITNRSCRNYYAGKITPAPYHKPIKKPNVAGSYDDNRNTTYDSNGNNTNYYRRDEEISNSNNNINHSSSNYKGNNAYQESNSKYNNTQHNWSNRNNSSYNYINSESGQNDGYYQNRYSDSIRRNPLEPYSDQINDSDAKLRYLNTNVRVNVEQNDRRGYAMSKNSSYNEPYNNWQQHDRFRESSYPIHNERNNHEVHKHEYNNYHDFRAYNDYSNAQDEYDSFNYKRHHPHLPEGNIGRTYNYNYNRQEHRYSPRQNMPHRR